VARNPGYMTGPGTNTYIVGRRRFLVIDPGPPDEVHVERILAETEKRIDAVLVTHTHPDHSPAAKLLRDATGAELLGRAPPGDGRQDLSFAPSRVLSEGDLVEVDDFALRAIHTPGHASNHLCYLLEGTGYVFTGDHLMEGSTVVIAPPDGDMQAYLDSLARLAKAPVTHIAPGHGRVIANATGEIARVIAHRLQREAKVLERLQRLREATLDALVVSVYDDVDPRLHPVAKSSLLAHLIKLAADGKVAKLADGATWTTATRASCHSRSGSDQKA
jgi:glyoxylase-like metal-dependent hydrolase (beta-lactamase superfamily II)